MWGLILTVGVVWAALSALVALVLGRVVRERDSRLH
jgi:hypothetical protein